LGIVEVFEESPESGEGARIAIRRRIAAITPSTVTVEKCAV
jgi:hypothetical protein